MKKILAGFLWGAFVLSASADDCRRILLENISGLKEQDLQSVDALHPSTSRVLKNFYDISGIFRASKFEDEIRSYLILEAKKFGLSYEVDEAGNLLIRVPSNQKNPDQQPWVSLHSHLDMVAKVEGLKTREDYEAFLDINGGVLPLEFRDGALQSLNQRNTIGNDNGSGIAIMMEYMRNPHLVRPNLELVFTVLEEDGLIGASKFSLPLKSKKMISLDSGETNLGLVGANGASRQHFSKVDLKRKTVSPEHEIFKITLTGFKGGHSGLKIKEGRANAVKELTLLLRLLGKSFPESEVVSFVGGAENAYNVIPNEFSLEVALDPSKKNELLNLLQWVRFSWGQHYSKIENLADVKIGLQSRSQSGESFVPWSEISPLTNFLVEIKDGASNGEWGALNIPRLSSNLSFLILDQNGVRGGLMPRFYDSSSFDKLTQENLALLHQFVPDFSWKTVTYSGEWRAFEGDLSQQVLQNARAVGLHDFKLGIAEGSIEPSEFSRIFPDLEIITIGVEVPGAHEPTEQFPIRDLAYILRLVDLTLTQQIRR